MRYLDEKLVAMKVNKDQIDANNTVLNRTNMLLIENMTKTNEQRDEAAANAQIIRINAWNVGGDIIRYQCVVGLEHQPSPRGWVESSPVAGRPNFSFFSRVGPTQNEWAQQKNIYSKNHFGKSVISLCIFLRHFD